MSQTFTGDPIQLLWNEIAKARKENRNWIEVPKEVMETYSYTQTGKVSDDKFFWFHNVKVYREGVRAEVEKAERLQVGQLLHGDKESFVVTG